MGLSARDIVRNANMTPESSVYSGRGNKKVDLNSDTIQRVYEGVRAEHGADAAQAFVRMVDGLEKSGDASATSFLVSLYELEQNGWINDGVSTGATALAASLVDANPNASVGAMASLLSRGSSTTPASDIMGDFLKDHSHELSQEAGTRKVHYRENLESKNGDDPITAKYINTSGSNQGKAM